MNYARYNFKYLERLFDSLFKVNGLPDTMDINYINWQLNRRGYVTLLRAGDGTLRSLGGAISGVDVYHRPIYFESANPVSRYSGLTRTIGKDCVVMRNTLNKRQPQRNTELFTKYAELLANVDISLDTAIYNSRGAYVFNAHNDQEAQKIRAMYDQVILGKPMVFTAGLNPVDALRGGPRGPLVENLGVAQNYIVDRLVRDRWAILCQFLTEIGINNSPFEKAERLIQSEEQSNMELLEVAQFEYLTARREAWDEFNTMFSQNVTIEVNAAPVRQIMAQVPAAGGDDDV